MLKLRKSQDRGQANHGWLKSFHSFSFADYYDPEFMGFRSLRVINEDFIAPAMGFGKHPHRDMEIVSYVVKGSLEHKDSLGSQSIIRPGEIQFMSAGTGILHSEFNPEQKDETHLLQIWIMPSQTGVTPKYGQIPIAEKLKEKKLLLVVSGDGREGSIQITQDAKLYVGKFVKSESVKFEIQQGRHAWLQLIHGKLDVNGALMDAGDGLAVSDESHLQIATLSESEFLLFDLV